MAAPSTPVNYWVQQANRQVLCSWDLSSGATSYDLKRSTDGITYSSIATPATNSYLDTTVTTGTKYYYQVAAVNGSGTSQYTAPQLIIPSPTGEMCLGEIRTRAQQRADRLNSNFVTLPEWNFFINQAMYELYDLLITVYEDYYVAQPAAFMTDGSTFLYPLPNGVLTFTDTNGQSFVAKPFYKLLGIDLGLSNVNNAFVTMRKFNFIDRNKFVYPNSNSTIYGVFNMQYRVMGDKIEIIPTPSAGQPLRLWYVPRLTQLLQDTDITDTGISGWLQYVIVRAAKYALDKEESDTSKLDQEILFLKERIESSASNRDAGMPDKISDTNGNNPFGYNGPFDGFKGGM